MRAVSRKSLGLAALIAVLLVAAVGGASAHEGHGADANASHDGNLTDDGTGDDAETNGGSGGDIPWFPIITGGLLLLAVAIMVVRRVIEARQDDAGDDGDGAE